MAWTTGRYRDTDCVGQHYTSTSSLCLPHSPWSAAALTCACKWNWKGGCTISKVLTVNTLNLLFCLLCYVNFRFRWYLLASPTFLLLLLKPKRCICLLLPHLPELVDHKFFLIFLMSNFQLHFFFSISPYFSLPCLSLTWMMAIYLELVFFVPKAPPPHCC